jgi:ParB family chromosome partitioning protein
MTKKTGLGRGLGSLITGGVNTPAKKTTTPTKKGKSPKASGKGSKGTKSAGKASKAKKVASKTVPPASIEGTRPFPGRSTGNDSVKETAVGLYEIAIAKIAPNTHQPRKSFDEGKIDELAESIREEGLLQPVVVRPDGKDGFELIAGERRWRACRKLKLKYITARILQATETSSAVLSLIENLQRENLNPIEEALGYASLIKDFDLTQEQASQRVGRSRAAVANALRLLQLPREVQGYLIKGHLSVGHAKVLLGVEQEERRLMLARQVIEHGWSVRETENQVQRQARSPGGGPTHRTVPAEENAAIRSLEEQLATTLSTRVQLKHGNKRGRIIIDYHGNEDLQRIIEQIGIR